MTKGFQMTTLKRELKALYQLTLSVNTCTYLGNAKPLSAKNSLSSLTIKPASTVTCFLSWSI